MDSTRGEIQLSGSSQLVAGEARVFFDYSFSSIISDITPIKILTTPTSIMQGQLYVDSKSQYGFVVKELNGSTTTAPPAGGFDWLVIARRKGFEDKPASSSASPQPEAGQPSVETPSETPPPAGGGESTPTPTPAPDLSTESSGGQASPTPTPSDTPIPTSDTTPTPSPAPDATPTPASTPDATPIPTP